MKKHEKPPVKQIAHQRPPEQDQLHSKQDPPTPNLSSPTNIVRLQSLIGNQGVQRLLKTSDKTRIMRNEFEDGAYFDTTKTEEAGDPYRTIPPDEIEQNPYNVKIAANSSMLNAIDSEPSGSTAEDDHYREATDDVEDHYQEATDDSDDSLSEVDEVYNEDGNRSANTESDNQSANSGPLTVKPVASSTSLKTKVKNRIKGTPQSLSVKQEFNLKSRHPLYKNEADKYDNKGQITKYITNETERSWHEAKAKKKVFGKSVVEFGGDLLDTTSFTMVTAMGGQIQEGRAIFVIASSGKLYIADQGGAAATLLEFEKFHHTTLVGGEPIIAAGEIWAEKGVIKGISDKSGHYMFGETTDTYTIQALQHFKDNGISVDDLKVELYGRGTVKAGELLNEVKKQGIEVFKSGKIDITNFKSYIPWQSTTPNNNPGNAATNVYGSAPKPNSA